MGVEQIETVVLLFPNIAWTKSQKVAQLQPDISFAQAVNKGALEILSAGFSSGHDIRGFTYVPDLDTKSYCHKLSESLVPNNVTRLADLPRSDFTLVAVAPWINAECTQEYLASARAYPTRAFLFYLPGNSSSKPPHSKSPVWNLEDQGLWKKTNRFSVYAVASTTGTQLMRQLSLYSGNMTQVPDGHVLAALPGGDSRDYVRLYTYIHINYTVGFQMVLYLTIIAGILISIICTATLVLKLVQRLQRSDLQQRMARGEVDLEALGIKRSSIAQLFIDSLPLYICQGAGWHDISKTVPRVQPLAPVSYLSDEDSDDQATGASWKPSTITPPTIPESTLNISPELHCAICANAFEREGLVRRLPCCHTFHAACIELSLQSSTMCPVCRISVLPYDYHPKITNCLVRRERKFRKLQASSARTWQEQADC
ncbi:hypothetical protein BJ878DRAFT_154254 [Calycina marina]|uniref:RING-type domain-containing protein n=1 Tax=Calycina marina TaxID=1763456 RepID=A0A9P8CD87_9HELO|nr:hypothetical protein BJ878DRAFT_154254 [Calycina marina]